MQYSERHFQRNVTDKNINFFKISHRFLIENRLILSNDCFVPMF